MKPTAISHTHSGRKPQMILFVILLALSFFLTFTFVSPVSSLGGIGTGPGGVGATDGSGTLEVWYQSNKTLYSDTGCSTPQTTDGGTVACWPDQSGNAFEATSSVSGERPTLQTGSGETWNGNRVINWDGGDILVTSEDITLGPLTLFFVYNASADGYIYMHSPRASSGNYDGSYMYTDVGRSFSVTRSSGGAEAGEDITNNWGVNSTPRIVVQRYNGTAATHTVYVNGTAQSSSNMGSDAGTASVADTFSIGARSFDGALRITGNYAEVIAYNEYLNSAQQILVENYLQAKFNDSVANNITISNDRYDGDTTASGDFDLDVAGIGRATSTETHTEAHSVGMIVQNNTFLQDDGDYLLLGHLTPTNSNVATDLPGGWGANARRWARHWYIDVTDVSSNGGLVDIIFDFSEGGMNGGGSAPVGPASNYHLLGRSGTSGAFASVTTASSVSGDQVIFSGVSVASLGSNFTLGSENTVSSPTLVEMSNAAATTPSPSTFLIVLALLILTTGTLFLSRRLTQPKR